MQDNGLVKYFKDKASSNGYLQLNKVDYTQDPVLILKHNIDGQDFYVKKCTPFTLNAEVLLSQLYYSAGVPTAIYMPGQKGRQVVAISNSVESDCCIKASEFFKNIHSENHQTHDYAALSHFKNFQMVDYSKYYTEQGLRDLILMQALDTASFNTDRHMQNYYAQVNDPYGDLKAQHFISFDYGASAGSSEKYLEHISFFNTFGTTCMNFDKDASLKTREEMISCFRENETINSYMPRQDIAEILGNLDVKGTVKEIYEATGFEVDRYYANNIEKSICQTAEELAK